MGMGLVAQQAAGPSTSLLLLYTERYFRSKQAPRAPRELGTRAIEALGRLRGVDHQWDLYVILPMMERHQHIVLEPTPV